jgi:hypothetical protein
VTALLP